MKEKTSEGISFADEIGNFNFTAHIGVLIHILCINGSFSFTRNHVRFNVSSGDYVILTPGIGITDLSFSKDIKSIILFFPESIVFTSAIRSNYGVLGNLSLIENPVLKLSSSDFNHCLRDLEYLRERNANSNHIFHDELTGALLKAHIMDLYDIHARTNRKTEVNSQPARIMRSFIEMLINEDYIGGRKLERYASQLCITPHYLTEISKKISGRPATYWIELFLIRAATIALLQSNQSIEEIAETLSFSSLSHFSRFVKSKTGLTPTLFRSQLNNKSRDK